MIRLGLCCKFNKEPIRFRTTTATYTRGLSRSLQLERLSNLCLDNSKALLSSIEYCVKNNIGCFRVNSQILPLKKHPDIRYEIKDLPDAQEIKDILSLCKQESNKLDIRLTFHPDQFVLLSSVKTSIIKNSIQELDYQSEVCELIGADVINIHAGGSYGDKRAALKRLGKEISKLKKRIRTRLTIENDDRIYTPKDLLPFCKDYGIPFVYDVLHHRCLSDSLSIRKVTSLALKTWDREPLFHISSPKYGWGKSKKCWHSDYIDKKDFPEEWKALDITVEVEAKAKELAVKRLYKVLQNN